MKKLIWPLVVGVAALFAGITASAAVTGARTEVFGTQTPAVDFTSWLGHSEALLTPESIQLATQACLRKTQQSTDEKAYPLAHQITLSLGNHFGDTSNQARSSFATALSKLATLLKMVDDLGTNREASTPDGYRKVCRNQLQSFFTRERSGLAILYQGRMQPKPDPKLARRGLEVMPLTWEGLTSQTCDLEGYYTDPRHPELWRFFSLTRLMQNILPSESQDEAFQREFANTPELVESLTRLNRYAGVAGKINGPAIGMTSGVGSGIGLRLTGPAAGSRATSLLATYTTAWREQLQWLTLNQNYPENPFALISSGQILQSLSALDPTIKTNQIQRLSSTEIGMWLWREMLAASSDSAGTPRPTPSDYGPQSQSYRATAALAWLALNAESNLRANEKLPGVRYGSEQESTNLVFGNPTAYELIREELDTARTQFALVDFEVQSSQSCLRDLTVLTEQAKKIPVREVGTVASELTAGLSSLAINPVYADIGLEVEDGDAGTFRLALATGYGHITLIPLNGKTYELWSPSAMVAHRPTLVNSRDWKRNQVTKYDRLQ